MHMHAFLYFVFCISTLLYFLENGCVFSIVMGEASAWTLGSRTHTAWTNRHPLHSTTLSPQFLFLTKTTILPYYHRKLSFRIHHSSLTIYTKVISLKNASPRPIEGQFNFYLFSPHLGLGLRLLPRLFHFSLALSS